MLNYQQEEGKKEEEKIVYANWKFDHVNSAKKYEKKKLCFFLFVANSIC